MTVGKPGLERPRDFQDGVPGSLHPLVLEEGAGRGPPGSQLTGPRTRPATREQATAGKPLCWLAQATPRRLGARLTLTVSPATAVSSSPLICDGGGTTQGCGARPWPCPLRPGRPLAL